MYSNPKHLNAVEAARETLERVKDAELYQEAVRHYGLNNQLIVAIEEASELQKEICKVLRGDGNLSRVSEEIADTLIMIDQLIQHYQLESAVEKWKEIKLERLEARIGKGI